MKTPANAKKQIVVNTCWRILNMVLAVSLLAAGCMPGSSFTPTPAITPPTRVPPTATRQPTNTPTQTPWPTYTTAPLPTKTPTPTPLPRLPTWLYPTDPHERELFDRVRRPYYLANWLYHNSDDPAWKREPYERACGDVFIAAENYLSEFPDTLAAAAVYVMVGNTCALTAVDDFPHLRTAYRQAIETYLTYRDQNVSPMAGLLAIGLPIVWSKETDVDGDARADTLIKVSPELWHSSIGALFVLRAPGQDEIVSHVLPTRYSGTSDGDEYDHSPSVWKIADINQDGRIEIVTRNWHAYAGGAGLCIDVFQWQGADFASILDWGTDDAYYGDAYMRTLSGTGALEIVVEAGKGWEWNWDWSRKLKQVRFYQWDGQRYVRQVPLPYSEYVDHSAEEANYYFFEAHDYSKALAKYEEALERAHPGSWELPLEWRMNIIACYKLLGDQVNFQSAYTAFREAWPSRVAELDARLAKLEEGEP